MQQHVGRMNRNKIPNYYSNNWCLIWKYTWTGDTLVYSMGIRVCRRSVHGSMDCEQEYTSVAVILTHFRAPTQRPLVPSFTSVVGWRLGRELFTFPYAAADVHGAMGCDQKSFTSTLVRRWHQPLSGSLPNSRVSHRLGRELFNLLS